MYKIFVFGLSIILIAGGALFVSAVADTTDEKEQVSSSALRVGEKVARGTQEALFGWTEIPKEMVKVSHETKNPAWGILAGAFRGLAKAVQMTTSGISEIITAPMSAERKR